jgi:hypothetical protein
VYRRFLPSWSGYVGCAALIAFGGLANGCGGDVAARAGSTDPGGIKTAAGAIGLGPAATDAARAKGRKACAGGDPLKVARAFAASARRSGTTRHFVDLVADPAPSVAASPAYPRLVASLYATTLPPRERPPAAAGCVEELTASKGRQ